MVTQMARYILEMENNILTYSVLSKPSEIYLKFVTSMFNVKFM